MLDDLKAPCMCLLQRCRCVAIKHPAVICAALGLEYGASCTLWCVLVEFVLVVGPVGCCSGFGCVAVDGGLLLGVLLGLCAWVVSMVLAVGIHVAVVAVPAVHVAGFGAASFVVRVSLLFVVAAFWFGHSCRAHSYLGRCRLVEVRAISVARGFVVVMGVCILSGMRRVFGFIFPSVGFFVAVDYRMRFLSQGDVGRFLGRFGLVRRGLWPCGFRVRMM